MISISQHIHGKPRRQRLHVKLAEFRALVRAASREITFNAPMLGKLITRAEHEAGADQPVKVLFERRVVMDVGEACFEYLSGFITFLFLKFERLLDANIKRARFYSISSATLKQPCCRSRAF
jgi:hypothetical protein